MKESMTRLMDEAQTVLVGKGKERQACIGMLDAYGPPELSETVPFGQDADGREYWRVRFEEALNLLESGMLPEGTVAIGGSEAFDEYKLANPETALEGEIYNDPDYRMGNVELLLQREKLEASVVKILGDGEPFLLVTSLPGITQQVADKRDWNVKVVCTPKGTTETITRMLITLGFADGATDIVDKGVQAAANGFLTTQGNELTSDYPIETVLRPIYPVVVWRRLGTAVVGQTAAVDLNTGIDAMDRTLQSRYASLSDPAVRQSDTTRLLGSTQKALAKSVEEGLELALAVLTGESDRATVAELADCVRADVLFVNSLRTERTLPPITFRAFLEELILRNQPQEAA